MPAKSVDIRDRVLTGQACHVTDTHTSLPTMYVNLSRWQALLLCDGSGLANLTISSLNNTSNESKISLQVELLLRSLIY